MCAYGAGRSPANVIRTAIAPLLVIAAGMAGSGCATNNAPHYATAPAVAGYTKQAAVDVQVEDDGLPVQAAPLSHIREMPDDPSEPFSRNYGGSNPAANVRPPHPASADNAAPRTMAAIPDDLPPVFRQQLAQAGYDVE
ncbi:adhesin [Hyphomicrobium methylovorum]|uniref:adhesin n=1 Tax=Hyphomicrobium methylovorum TaxID=84 RepID=UPI0015E6D3F6|nr:adhesin [Hyphomicrobium methylovorum]MBA2127113.1 adhesin [Hyphomicrobium methylovorum]